jgi:phage terminase large subunit-like protein
MEENIVFGGLDLSEVNDLTALVLTTVRNGNYSVKCHFWLPEEGLAERARQDRVPYDVWAKEGYITLCPGRSVEYEYVAAFIAGLFDEYDVRKIAFDRWNMRHLRPWLIKAGLSEALLDDRFQDFGQGFQSMSPALRNLESILLNAKMRHGNHPVLNMCAANSVVKTDEAGGRKLDKKRSRGRIDGMVALAMACAVANEHHGNRPVYPVDLESILT